MVILKDSREHEGKGWDFEGQVVKALKTGDYSLEGQENLFVIERKGSIAEFAQNVYQRRFEKELERLENFKHPFIILEFELSDIILFPQTSNIPQYKWPQLQVTSGFILKRLCEFQCKYKTKIIFAGKFGKNIAISLFKRIESCHSI